MKWKSWSRRLENMEDETNNRVSERNESEQSNDREEENNARGKGKEKRILNCRGQFDCHNFQSAETVMGGGLSAPRRSSCLCTDHISTGKAFWSCSCYLVPHPHIKYCKRLGFYCEDQFGYRTLVLKMYRNVANAVFTSIQDRSV
jgi:hypothetical protein